MTKEVKELLNKCDNCKLKECIGCEFTCTEIQKIKEYVEQKESILDKVTDKLKEDIERFDKYRKMHKMYSASEERLSSKYFYAFELLEFIKGEKE